MKNLGLLLVVAAIAPALLFGLAWGLFFPYWLPVLVAGVLCYAVGRPRVANAKRYGRRRPRARRRRMSETARTAEELRRAQAGRGESLGSAVQELKTLEELEELEAGPCVTHPTDVDQLRRNLGR